MHRYHAHRALRGAKLSALEECSLLVGLVLITAALTVAFLWHHTGGSIRAIALIGFGSVAICAGSRGVRLYRAGVTASLPTSVARVEVPARPPAAISVITPTLALALPLAAVVTVLAVVYWSWLVLAGVLLLGSVGLYAASAGEKWGERAYAQSSPATEGLLQRLCMRADMRVPELVVESGAVASAWTSGGRIHVTRAVLELLDDAELEAVLAHELAHLAHRDAAEMEICSAPSRLLLTFTGFVTPRLVRWIRGLAENGGSVLAVALAFVAVLGIPPSFVIGWISRLSVLGMSRAREFSADAAAATLTGRPSALASALLKLERQREWTPRADLRQVEAFAVLCIVGRARPRIGRLFSTHPPIAERVERLTETELRIQRPYA
jgi:heat shock protein HtpX